VIGRFLLNQRLILYTSWRYLVRHAIQSLLMVVGISLGVAVAVAIDLANVSASKALDLSAQSIAGKATHQITELPSGLDESIYREIKLNYPQIPTAPQVNDVVLVDELGDRPVTLMGIDPLAEAPFRSYIPPTSKLSDGGLSRLFTQPGAVALSRQMADLYHVRLGDWLTVHSEGNTRRIQVVGILDPGDDLARQTLDGVLVADIATAQEALGKIGRLDQIDLILPADAPQILAGIRGLLPQGAMLAQADARANGLNQMTAAFQLNLTALSLLAMMVGMFLIYNTMTFSVIQRRPLFGTLRSLGVTRREIFGAVLVEALLVGVVGSILGLGAGIFLGRTTIGMVSQTVNDLYYTTTVRDVGLPLISLVKGLVLGIAASLLTAVPPAWEACTVPASEALSRISLENKTRLFVKRTTLGGAAAFLAGWGVLAIPSRSLYTGFGGLILVVFAFALITALLMVGLMRIVNPLTHLLLGLVGKLAPRNLVNSLSRTAIAVSALMVALAVAIGVNLMVDSFRSTVNTWLNASLMGDIYVTAPNFKSNQPTAPIDTAMLDYLKTVPEVTRLDLLKIGYVATADGEAQISATDNYTVAYERLYKFRWVPVDQIWTQMQQGGVLITEPLAFKLGIDHAGQSIRLITKEGERDFPVLGVYYDYASTSGTVQMTLDQYQRYWDDRGISAIGVRVKEGTDTTTLASRLKMEAPTRQSLLIRPNKVLRDDVMVVFERTFAITRALQILSTLVAFVGILNSLSLLQFEKQREVGIIRALGFTPRQLWGLVMLETGLMGLVSGLVAMPAGYTLALILIEVINRRSFGWSLQLALTARPFLEALLVAVVAALLAGLAPARKLSRMQAVEAIRYE
jgi:putative ABC transport system permease protein